MKQVIFLTMLIFVSMLTGNICIMNLFIGANIVSDLNLPLSSVYAESDREKVSNENKDDKKEFDKREAKYSNHDSKIRYEYYDNPNKRYDTSDRYDKQRYYYTDYKNSIKVFECPPNSNLKNSKVTDLKLCDVAIPAVMCPTGSTLTGVLVHPLAKSGGICNIDIKQGPKGDKGDKGDQGLPGVNGEKGDKGDKGDRGLKGEHGLRGLQGETGKTGPSGPNKILSSSLYSKTGTAGISSTATCNRGDTVITGGFVVQSSGSIGIPSFSQPLEDFNGWKAKVESQGSGTGNADTIKAIAVCFKNNKVSDDSSLAQQEEEIETFSMANQGIETIPMKVQEMETENTSTSIDNSKVAESSTSTKLKSKLLEVLQPKIEQ
jgi:hypothetical protein